MAKVEHAQPLLGSAVQLEIPGPATYALAVNGDDTVRKAAPRTPCKIYLFVMMAAIANVLFGFETSVISGACGACFACGRGWYLGWQRATGLWPRARASCRRQGRLCGEHRAVDIKRRVRVSCECVQRHPHHGLATAAVGGWRSWQVHVAAAFRMRAFTRLLDATTAGGMSTGAIFGSLVAGFLQDGGCHAHDHVLDHHSLITPHQSTRY